MSLSSARKRKRKRDNAKGIWRETERKRLNELNLLNIPELYCTVRVITIRNKPWKKECLGNDRQT